MTSNLPRRVWQHKSNQFEGFSKKYKVKKLVYYEQHTTAENAIIREKQLKKWNRAWKLKLIEKNNSQWEDLYDVILQ